MRSRVSWRDRMRAILWVLQGKSFVFLEPKTFIVSNNIVSGSSASGIRVMGTTPRLPRIG